MSERVADERSELEAEALREFLRRPPHRHDEKPGWFAVALWAEDYLPSKPTPLAIEVELAELHREAA